VFKLYAFIHGVNARIFACADNTQFETRLFVPINVARPLLYDSCPHLVSSRIVGFTRCMSHPSKEEKLKRILKRGAIAAVTLSLLSGCSADRPGEVDEGMTAVIKQPLAYTPRGPGLGNLDYTAGELNQRISWVALNVDIPEEFPGLNNGYMFNGYFVGVFSEDNGWHGGGWSVLDISNPRVPVKMSTLKDAVWWAQYTDQRSMLTGDFRENHSTGFSIINNRWYAAIPTGHGIEIWDFTDVALNVPPTRASRTTIPNVTGGNYNNTSWQLAWQAPYVYVANTNLGITVINASNPTNPVVVSTTPTSSLGGAAVGAIYAMGNQLVISDMNNMGAVRVLDISNPTTPTLRTSHTPTENYYSSCFDGQEIFLTDRGATANLKVLSVNSTDSSISVIEADTVSNPEGLYCTTQGNSLFMGNQLNAKKFDITTPSNPVLVGTMSTGGVNADHGQVSVFGNLLYIGDDHGAGNAFMVHQQAKDLAAPRVKYVNPKSGAVTQNVKSRIGLAMTDSILIESMSTSTFIVRKQGTTTALPGFYSGTNGMINFSPSTDLQAGTTYEIVVPVGGLTDWSGNAIDQQFTSTFTTAGSSTTALAATVTSTTAVVTNTSVTFTSAGTGGTGPYQYSFNFGDGSAATAFSSTATASKTYTAPGHYNVVVTVKDSQNVTSTKAKLQIVHNPLTATLPTKSNSMALSGTNLYAVNTDSDSVTKLNADTLAQLWENVVEDEPTTVAVASNGNIWVVNQNSDKISVINSSGTDVATYTMPRGSRPFGIAFNPAGTQVYVTLEATGRLLKLSTTTGAIVSNIAVGADPRGIAVSGDGSKIYVTRHISAQTVAEVREVASSTFTVTRTINLQNDTTTVNSQDRSRGLPNYLVNIGISPDGLRAWIPSTKTNTANSSLTFETSVRTIASQINLSTGTEVFADQKDFDDSALAMDVSFSPKGDYAFFALEGNNRVIAIDAYSRANVVTMLTDSAPKGLIVNSAGTKLYVHNFLSRNVQSFDVSALTNATGSSAPELAKTSTITTEPLSAQVLTGKKIFYRASDARMSRDAYISCASCHLDGDSDRRVWDFTTRGEGFRNTRTLIGSAGTRDGRVHWTGNFDEIQDFENDIRNAFGGSGLLSDADFTTTSNPLGTTKAGRSADLDALAAYVTFLSTMPKSPYRNADGTMTAAGTAGQTVFNSKNCASCHGGAYYTNGTRHDVGTIQANSGQGIGAPLAGVGFDTPSLLGLWFGEPYLHNGQAATLSAVLNSASHGGTNTLTAQQRSDLEQFLLQIDSPAAVGTPTCSDTIKNQSESDVDCGGSSCALCATGKTCSVGTSCASGICTSGLCAAAGGGTTYQAETANIRQDSIVMGTWLELDDLSSAYVQWNSVVAGTSITARVQNSGIAGTLVLYINGVSKETRTIASGTPPTDLVFNYPVAAGQAVKIAKPNTAIIEVDYIKVQ